MGYDKEDVRGNATNRWTEILTHFGLPGEALDGRHQPCPKCGGTDRWRVFDDFEEKGGAICNKCLENAGDGFEVAAWWTGKRFADVVNEIGELLGMKPSEKKKGKKEKKEFKPEVTAWKQGLIPLFLMRNPGITERGLELSGVVFGKYQKQTALMFKVFDEDLKTICGYVAMSPTSKYIGVFNPETEQTTLERKACVGGSKSGLVGEESIRLISAGGIVETIWKVEGPTDLAALISIIPEEDWGKHVVITASTGAKKVPAGAAQFLTNAQGVCVIGDCDDTGKKGAERWAREIARAGGKARIVELPYEFSESNGKDIRDFIMEHGPLAWWKLQELAEATKITTRNDVTRAAVDGNSVNIPSKYQDALDDIGLDVLCEDQSSIYVYSLFTQKSDVIKGDLGKLSTENLIRITGPRAAPMIGDKEEQYDIKDIRMAIAMAASGRRVEDAQGTMRGIGVYKGNEDGEDCVVVCNGSHLSVLDHEGNWKKVDRPRYGGLLFAFNGKQWYDHDTIGRLIQRAKVDSEWVRFQWENLRHYIDRWTWKSQQTDPTLLTALIGATWIQDLWRYRPQVSLRGPSNAGKSQFCAFLFGGENKEPGLFGDLAFCRALPSAAGIRQAVGKSSRVICIDEFDSLNPRAKSEIVKIIRTAGPGDTITLGSASHKAIEFGLKAICWVSGVMVGLEEQMDSNRFIPFDLEKPPKARWDAWKAPTLTEKEDIRRAIMAITIAHGLRAASIAKNLHQKITSVVHDRTVEGLAGAASVWALSLGGTDRDALELLQGFVEAITSQAIREVADDTHLETFDSIMAQTIHVGGQMQMTVGTILDPNGDFCDTASEHCRQLQSQLGLSVMKHSGEKYLAVHHPTIAKRFQKTSSDVAQLLRRIEGAADAHVKIAATTRRCILIPWGFVVSRSYSGSEETAEAAF